MHAWTIKEPTTLTFDTHAVRRLKIRIIGGGIHVVGGSQPPNLEVSEITGQDLQVRLDDSGALDIGYDRAGWTNLGPIGFLLGKGHRTAVQLAVAVAPDTPIAVEIVSGSTMISGIDGRVDVHGISGDATLARLAGEIDVETVSGSVEAEQVAGELHIKTVSGDVTVVDLSGSRAGVKTVSGAVALDVAEPIPTMRIDTISGDATIRVPFSCSLDARLTTTSGQVASSFSQLHRGGWPATKAAEGRIGAGGPMLRAHTVSGHVTVLGRDAEDQSGPPVSAGESGSAQ